MQIIKLNAIDSTNRYLADLVSEISLEDFAAVMAKEQTNGQGQRGSKWQSEKGKNLIISILKKNIKSSVRCQFDVNRRVSLAVYKTLKAFEIPKLSVKWPNDILSCDKKISGILIQLLTKKQRIQHGIIGVGINVNQTHFKDLPRAASMKTIKAASFDLDTLAKELIKQLKFYFEISDRTFLNAEYEAVLFRMNKTSTFLNKSGQAFKGVIKGVSNSGKLKVQSDNITDEYDLKTIQFIY
ncbi:MAG: biotin--[acetyl-CoA-carboxylase] ligase [Flavobacteriaceae bacterium]|nr:biotin--[acetyl-CoA-carboxylase] ligase [Flavobacteriaceae bacterium]|tara:strand:- start:5662 stop:6381 length:720 start_codon:yes stop_codon:yes gene_type:complete